MDKPEKDKVFSAKPKQFLSLSLKFVGKLFYNPLVQQIEKINDSLMFVRVVMRTSNFGISRFAAWQPKCLEVNKCPYNWCHFFNSGYYCLFSETEAVYLRMSYQALDSPVIIQTENRIHVMYGRVRINKRLMNTVKSGRTGTKGTVNRRGVLFCGNQRRSSAQQTISKLPRIKIKMAHHFAIARWLGPQTNKTPSATKLKLETTITSIAKKAVFSEGCWAWRTPNSGESSIGVLWFVCPTVPSSEWSSWFTKPTVSGLYRSTITQTATAV